jgi:preprotein translocase subunit SecD
MRIDKKLIVIAVIFVAIAAALIMTPKYAGLLLMFSLILFGALAVLWREGNVRLACLGALVLLSIINISVNGLKFGIDFAGGTRIPVLLERPVDSMTMEELINIIKTRTSVLGLTEVKVKAIGDSEIDVEVPSASEEQIAFIESVLSHQGVYLAVVDGKIALRGEDIYPHSIYKIPQQYLGNNDWGVGFSITQSAAEKFANVVYGKANYPLYMFLDREENAVVFLTKAQLKANAPEFATDQEIYDAVSDAIRLEGSTLSFYVIDENKTMPEPLNNQTKAIISKNTNTEFKATLLKKGYILKEKEEDEIKPKITDVGNGKLVVSEWKAIGLLDAPALHPSITTGKINKDYSIGGRVQFETAAEKQKAIEENTKRIESILKGGSLPVGITLGSATSIPPSLGSEFLRLSMMGIGAALFMVALFVGVRYRHWRVIVAILAISISELIILTAILGSFTIDLAGVAGIIGAVGVGVDAQVVITDELLKKKLALAERLKHAFDIIKMNVVVAVVAMLPLLFSGLVEVIGFAIANMLGLLLGFLLSRPAYGVLAEKILGEDE